MIILFVAPEFLEKNKAATGLPNYLYRVSKSLIELGHEPIIITAGNRNENTRYEGIEVIRKSVGNDEYFKSEALNYIVKSVKMNNILTKEVNKLCSRKKVDIIQFCSLYGLGMFYTKNVPAIMRLSSYAKKYFMYSDTYSKTMIRVMSLAERSSGRRMQGIIAPSNIMAEAYSKDTNRKVQVIETPFVDDALKKEEEEYNRLFGDKKYALFFGTLYAEKGIFVIAKIIKKFLKNNPDYYFGFIGSIQKKGDSNPLSILYQEAGEFKDRVIYSKPIKHEVLYPIIEHADFVVLPSLMDNLPNACIEAMYFKRIVIGTDGCSFEQLIEDGRNGFLVKPNNADSLYEKMQEVTLLDADEKEKMGQRARSRIDQLRPEKAVVKLLRYYNYIIENHKEK